MGNMLIITGLRYLISCFWSFDLGHFSTSTSLPSPTSNLPKHATKGQIPFQRLQSYTKFHTDL